MYAYIRGKLTRKTPTFVHLETGGVGFAVQISLHTYSKIEHLDETILYTHLYIKEDAHQIFGFFDEEEKVLFIQLISVSGIGPNTARIILSSMTPLEVRTAITLEDDDAFKKVKGVGPKTAKRVILDLKDKIQKSILVSATTPNLTKATGYEEAIDALMTLGFQKQKIQKVLGQISLNSDMNTEMLIKLALQKLT